MLGAVASAAIEIAEGATPTKVSAATMATITFFISLLWNESGGGLGSCKQVHQHPPPEFEITSSSCPWWSCPYQP
jgi:hypothetical protein